MKEITEDLKEAGIKLLHVELNIRQICEADDMPKNLPVLVGNTWKVKADIDSGLIIEWPAAYGESPTIKTMEQGDYRLLSSGGYQGDIKINEKGYITSWYKNPEVEDFPKTYIKSKG